jgi:hypothetical protein
VVLGLSLVLPALLPAQGLEATFADLKGEVEWSAAGSSQWEAASANTVLHAGDRVRTLANSSARLAYFEGSATALAAGTAVRIEEMRDEGDLRLLRLTQESGVTQGQVQATAGIPTNYEVTSASAVMLAPPRTCPWVGIAPDRTTLVRNPPITAPRRVATLEVPRLEYTWTSVWVPGPLGPYQLVVPRPVVVPPVLPSSRSADTQALLACSFPGAASHGVTSTTQLSAAEPGTQVALGPDPTPVAVDRDGRLSLLRRPLVGPLTNAARLATGEATADNPEESDQAAPAPALPPPAQPLGDQATLETVRPEVQWTPAGATTAQTVATRQIVRAGDRITTGPGGAARLIYFEGSVTELGASTTITLQRLDRTASGNIVTRLVQAVGATVSRVGQLVDPAATFEVETPAATAFVRGTTPEINVAPDGRTRVVNRPDGTSGQVIVRSQVPNVPEVTLGQGQATEIQRGQPPTTPVQALLGFGVGLLSVRNTIGDRIETIEVGPGEQTQVRPGSAPSAPSRTDAVSQTASATQAQERQQAERQERQREEQAQAEAQAAQAQAALVAAQAEMTRLLQQENALRQELTAALGALSQGGKGVAPSNDLLIGAASIASLPARLTANTASATLDPGEPDRPCAPLGRTLWYSLSVPTTATLVVDTFGSDFDTVLAVYRGTMPSLASLVACNDNTNGAQSRVTFTAQGGQTYLVQVGGIAGSSGNLVVNVGATVPPPPNDPFAGAVPVAGIGAQFTANTTSATTEGGERTQLDCGGGERPVIGNTVWYRLTPSTTNAIGIDTFGSNFDTVLAVYSGSDLGNLTLVRCDDDAALNTRQSQVAFVARAGTTYFVQAGGFTSAFGNLVVNFTAAPPPPANDDFSLATPISTLPALTTPPTPATFTARTISASVEPNEPTSFNCAGAAALVDNTVWYNFTPTRTMHVAVDTFGSDYDTVLAVWTGSALGSLAQVACNDETNEPGTMSSQQSRVTFQAMAGTTYRIQVGGARGSDPASLGASGNLRFNVAEVPPPPANDAFAAAIAVTVNPPTQITGVNTTSATIEPSEPEGLLCSGARLGVGGTVWYTFTPSANSLVEINTFGSTFDTIVAVYTGSTLPTLSQVACDNDTTDPTTGSARQSRVIMSAAAGTTYRVQIGGQLGQFGTLSTQFRTCPAAPANDNFAAATPVSSLPTSFNLDTTCATTEVAGGEPTTVFLCAKAIGNTVWYRFTAPTNTAVTIDTVGSSFDTIIGVYVGSALNRLTNVACNDDIQPGVLQSRLSFLAGAGTTYYVQVGGFNAAFGTLAVNFTAPPPPANDIFASAIALPAGTTRAVTFGASTEPGEPTTVDATCGPSGGVIGRTVWYTLTPTSNGIVTLDTIGSDFDTVLAVYTGSAVNALTRLACNDDAVNQQSQVTVPVMAGTPYRVQVGGLNGAAGNLVLNVPTIPGPGGTVLRAPPPPPPDPRKLPPAVPGKGSERESPRPTSPAPRPR